jgi:hypothetical protein
MYMLMCDKDEWNVINLMIFIGMLEMNYMTSALIILCISENEMLCNMWNGQIKS